LTGETATSAENAIWRAESNDKPQLCQLKSPKGMPFHPYVSVKGRIGATEARRRTKRSAAGFDGNNKSIS
jgi:hypothetical protein